METVFMHLQVVPIHLKDPPLPNTAPQAASAPAAGPLAHRGTGTATGASVAAAAASVAIANGDVSPLPFSAILGGSV